MSKEGLAMATESDRIVTAIEQTRADLVADVTALAERVSPRNMARRRWRRIRALARSGPAVAGLVVVCVGLVAVGFLRRSTIGHRSGRRH
jgi:hypothetical protein